MSQNKLADVIKTASQTINQPFTGTKEILTPCRESYQ